MYRLLTASKDTYITDKFVAGERALNANVGQAGTLDLFKLYNETFISATASLSGVFEKSRVLLQFDMAPLAALTASKVNLSDPSFKCYLQLKDVYGGQTTPSNFTLRLAPISRSWSEGRGYDVISFRDLDACNFSTSSISSGVVETWTSQGASTSGSLGDPTLDIITSGNLGSGLVDLTVSQFFTRGDENLFVDVTTLASATLAGLIPNHGWRLSFSDGEELDSTTRFVKRFGSRHTTNKELHPKLIVKYNDSIQDDSGDLEFNSAQQLFFYNTVNGSRTNFVSGSSTVTGSNCAVLHLIASKSISHMTNSWSVSHSASINHMTRSLYVITQSFDVSQFVLNGLSQTGIYTSSVDINLVTNVTVSNFLTGALSQQFRFEVLSSDLSYQFARGLYTFRKPLAISSNVANRNWLANITNLKQTYVNSETARLRIFVQDYDADQQPYRTMTASRSVILTNLKWRVLKAFSRDVVIPFDSEATLCSTDADGMYFDFYMSDLDPNEVYEFELMITENEQDYHISNAGFRFKVTP